MTGDIIIDGKDAYTEWGVILANGGLKELVCLPPLKDYPKNDWFEKDGIDADLSAPVLNTREMTLKFVSVWNFDGYFDFMAYLESAAEHSFYFKSVDRTFTLRLVSFPSIEVARRVGWLSVKFADDYPLKDYTYQAPSGGGVSPDAKWKFDEVKFTDYGIKVFKGHDELMRGHSVKTALLRNIKTRGGAIYDVGAATTYKSQDVKLQCLLRASSKTDMWRNWYAFLHDITTPGEHQIFSEDTELSMMSFCYKSCSVSEFAVSSQGRPWIRFALTLTITGNFRNKDDSSVLSAEDGSVMMDESEYTAFNVYKKR